MSNEPDKKSTGAGQSSTDELRANAGKFGKLFGVFIVFGVLGLVILFTMHSCDSGGNVKGKQGRSIGENRNGQAENIVSQVSMPDDPIKCSDVDPVNVTAPPMKNVSSPEDLANFGEYVRGVGYCTQASVPRVQNLRVLCTLLDGSTTTDLNRCQEGVLGIRYGSKSPHEIPVTISYMRTPG